jgi:hypothetical protein
MQENVNRKANSPTAFFVSAQLGVEWRSLIPAWLELGDLREASVKMILAQALRTELFAGPQ